MRNLSTAAEHLAKDLVQIWKAYKLPLKKLEDDTELARISMEGSDAELEYLIKNGADMEGIKRAELLSAYNHMCYESDILALKLLREKGYDR
jgi:hypothetical protein